MGIAHRQATLRLRETPNLVNDALWVYLCVTMASPDGDGLLRARDLGEAEDSPSDARFNVLYRDARRGVLVNPIGFQAGVADCWREDLSVSFVE